jgi:iron(III) transport system ATP-binding protein
MSALQINDLHKSFAAHTVLRGLDLEVPAGSLTAILGASGSGKTTLLRLLAGFDRPDAGTIKIDGRTVAATGTHVHPERRKIGYVPQEGGLFPHLTVQANIAFGLARAARRQGTGDLLEMVGLTGLERRYPHQLSGGQQQRVALARALAIKPEIVLLDEPFASLDAHQRVSVREDVRRILRESETTTLLVTHDQDEALSLADLLAVLRDGKIAQYSTPEDLYSRPVDHELARFVGEANILEGIIEGALVDTPLGRLPAHWQGEAPASGSAVSVLIRPEQIELNARTSDEGLTGEIVRTGYHGHDAVVHVKLGEGGDGGEGERAQPLIVRTLGDTTPPPGSQVGLSARGSVLVWRASSGNGDRVTVPTAGEGAEGGG